MNERLRILYLEDSPLDVELAKDALRQAGIACEWRVARNRADYEAALDPGPFDVILGDYLLPDYDGFAALALAREKHPHTPFIVVSGVLGEEHAVECFHRGAVDYVLKRDLSRLGPAITQALAKAEEHRKHREAVEALRENEAKVRTILESVHTGIVIIDAETHVIVEVNPIAANLIGEPREKIIGRICQKHICPMDKGHCPITDLGQTVDNSERVLLKSDGTRIPIIKTVSPILLGGRQHLLESFVDITKHKQVQEELRESEERYRLLADNADDFVVLNHVDGRRFYVSPSFYRVTGWTPEEFQSSDWRKRIHPDDLLLVEKTRAANLAGETTRIEYRMLCKNGSWLWMDTRCKPVAGPDGRVEQMQLWSRDITQRKQAEEEIRKLNAELERRVRERTAELEASNKELEAFSYSVSHDLRAPLRAINGFASMLVEDNAKQLDDEGRRKLDMVCAEAARMSQLIDDLLAFSRTSRQFMQMGETDMRALAQVAVDKLTAQAAGRKLQFTLPPLPPAHGDAALLGQVWMNLVSNAVKYTRPREVAFIEIGGRVEGGELLYYVKDNGVGFEMEYAGKLFSVFQRLHSVEDFEGTGVGLALTQRIIRRHGGRVWAEGKVNEGATFFFTLPHAPAAS